MADHKIKKKPRRQIPYLCRICLTGSSSMKELSQMLDNEYNPNISILNALKEVMSCEIMSLKHSPNHICSMCMSLLRISYNLKMQFRESQEKLFSKLEKGKQELEFNSNLMPIEQDMYKSEVEIIVGKENYSLRDILIVEEDESTEDCKEILKNLGKAVTLEYLENKSESKIGLGTQELHLSDIKSESSHMGLDDVNKIDSTVFLEDQISKIADFEEYETIIIQPLSDDELSSFHWEHEYAKNIAGDDFRTSEEFRQNRRKRKYPVSLMNKIESLIIEGDEKHDLTYNTNIFEMEKKKQ